MCAAQALRSALVAALALCAAGLVSGKGDTACANSAPELPKCGGGVVGGGECANPDLCCRCVGCGGCGVGGGLPANQGCHRSGAWVCGGHTHTHRSPSRTPAPLASAFGWCGAKVAQCGRGCKGGPCLTNDQITKFILDELDGSTPALSANASKCVRGGRSRRGGCGAHLRAQRSRGRPAGGLRPPTPTQRSPPRSLPLFPPPPLHLKK